MAVETFDQVYAEYNGVLFAYNTKVSIEWTDNNQDVETIPLGWAGQSQSPSKMMVTFTNALPSGGFILNVAKTFLEGVSGTLRLRLGGSGLSLISKGFIRQPKMDAGVGQTTTEDFAFVGEPAYFK